jgi:hypothetical protein
MAEFESLSEAWGLESGKKVNAKVRLRNYGLKSPRTLILSTVVVSIGLRRWGKTKISQAEEKRNNFSLASL